VKPMGWPRYMLEKALPSGRTAYYWNPPGRDLKAGFTLRREKLGSDYGAAAARAEELNRHLDAWRKGRGAEKSLDLQPGYGTLEWMVERYKRSRAWDKVSKRSRYEYERAFRLVLRHRTKKGIDLGRAPLAAITARGVDKLYEALQKGTKVDRRLRQANICMIRMARAWDSVQRLYPTVVAAANPFRGVELEHGKGTTPPASRVAAYALHDALVAAGEPHLAAVPLICFEWHQRPENVLAGHLTWTDYRSPERPNAVRILHHKTGELVWLPLVDHRGPLFPELTAYLDKLERLGVPMVLLRPQRKGRPARPFLLRTARNRVRAAARKAGLPDELTLVLSEAELVVVWRACGDDDHGRIVRLLILTGQRKSEIGDLSWPEVDLEKRQLDLPPERTKNRKAHLVPLSDQALAIIEGISRRQGRDLLFGIGAGGFSGWSKAKEFLDDRITAARAEAREKPLPGWTLHDIRRSVVTHLAESRQRPGRDGKIDTYSFAQPHVVEAIVNHVSGHRAGIAGVYNKAAYLAERCQALDLWGAHVAALVEGRASNVVRLRRGNA
jgi:integrase